jgi:hypothetical protein
MQPMPPGLIPGNDEDPPEGDLPEFPDRHREAFTGLAFLGALTAGFEWGGHQFRIRTLTTDENLAGALVVRDWEGTIGHQLAHTTVMAALCIVTVDGQPMMPVPLGEPEDGAVPAAYATAAAKFDWAKTHWYPWTVNEIFRHFLILENQVRQVLDAMEKVPAPSGATGGSSTRPGSPSDAGS